MYRKDMPQPLRETALIRQSQNKKIQVQEVQ
jgi:hypothetical protein